MNFKQELITALRKETALPEEEVANLLTIPPNPTLGDYAFPCFKLGKNPKDAAEVLKKKIQKKSLRFIREIKVAGPYLNFFLDKAVLAETILILIKKDKEKFGSGKKKGKIVAEFCSPNTNKPLHLGHVRNMALGDSIIRILRFQGNDVKAVEVVNDRGVHICQSMLAYQKWGNNKKPDKKSDHFVGDYYVLFSQKAKESPELKEEAQQMLQRWEANDKEIRALWKKMNLWVTQGFQETYRRFGISFDKEYFESAIYEEGKEIVQEGLSTGSFLKDDTGAVIAPLEPHGLSDKVVLRSDGTSVYITQDLYLAQLRYDDFKYDKMIYVVASEQNLHFKQLFMILKLLQRPFAEGLHHLSYGMVHLPSGRMKSREGTVIDADDILDEMANLAKDEVQKRYSDLSQKEIHLRAEYIALAALKFFMLKTDPIRDMVFNPEESLSFEGETGPYLQYTYARACSILRKAGKISSAVSFSELKEEKEHQLVVLLSKFTERIEEAALSYKPHILCRYLLDLAQLFNEFYHTYPVISEQKEQMKARLLLVQCVKQVLANGLSLLGITPLEEM